MRVLFRRVGWIALYVSLLGGGLGDAQGEEASGLYRAEVSPPTDGQAKQSELIRKALVRVLTRVSGTAEVAQDPQIRSRLLDRAQEVLERHQFLDSGGGHSGPRIRAQFAKDAINTALHRRGWPIWGRYRPALLVWVAVQREGGALDLATPDLDHAIFRGLRAAAKRWGVPLLVPVFDSTDFRNLSARALMFEDWDRIRTASQRYQPDAIGIVRIRGVSTEAPKVGRWGILDSETQQAFVTRDPESLQAMLMAGIARLAQHWSRQYGVYPDEQTTVEVVEVRDVADLAAFSTVERSLKRVMAIKELVPHTIRSDQCRFRLHVQGLRIGINRVLSLIDVLEPRFESVPRDGSMIGSTRRILRYRYQP